MFRGEGAVNQFKMLEKVEYCKAVEEHFNNEMVMTLR